MQYSFRHNSTVFIYSWNYIGTTGTIGTTRTIGTSGMIDCWHARIRYSDEVMALDRRAII